MKTILIIALPVLSSVALAQALPTFEETNPHSNYKHMKGEDILSIEETAMSYFEELRDRLERDTSEDNPFHPVNMLRDRDGLEAAEIQEIIGVALANPKAKPIKWSDTSCAAMFKATNSDKLLHVLEGGEAFEVAMRHAHGKAHLEMLTPKTRASLRKALVEFRKSITVGRMDWKKVRDVSPEAMESYRAYACTGVAK